jgi:hypothetical protein
MNNAAIHVQRKFWKTVVMIGIIGAISLVYGSFHLLYLHDRGWDYTNAIFISTFTQCRDTDFYLTHIKEVYEGHYKLSNLYLAEYKDVSAAARREFPIYAIAFLGKMLRLDVQSLPIIMDVTLPPLIFLLAYQFFKLLSASRRLSVCGAFTLVMTPQILFLQTTWNYMRHPLLKLHGIIPSFLLTAHGFFGTFGRTIYPQFVYIFLMAALFLFFKGIKTGRSQYLAGATISGIILSYSYVYLSTYLYCVLGVCVIVTWLLQEKRSFYCSLSVLLVILAASIPFWYSIAASSQEALKRISWAERTHVPILSFDVICVPIMTGVAVWMWRQGMVTRFNMMACVALLSGGFLCVNQQVVSGISVQPWHYRIYVLPESLLMAVVILLASYRQWRRARIPIQAQPITPSFSLPALMIASSLILASVGMVFHPAIVKWIAPDTYAAQSLSSEFLHRLEQIYQYSLVLAVGMLVGGIAFGKYCPGRLPRIKLETLCMALWIGYSLLDISLARYLWYVQVMKPNFSDLQQLAPALRWLDLNTAKESVVLSMIGKKPFFPQSEYASTDDLLAIYTHNNVYLSDYVEWFSIPSDDEGRDRLYNIMYFMGIRTPEAFQRFMHRMWSSGSFEEYQNKFGKDVYQELKKYRVDYVFYGPRERQYFQVDPATTYPFLKTVYADGVVQIYQIL